MRFLLVIMLTGCTNISVIGSDNEVVYDPDAGIIKKEKKVKTEGK